MVQWMNDIGVSFFQCGHFVNEQFGFIQYIMYNNTTILVTHSMLHGNTTIHDTYNVPCHTTSIPRINTNMGMRTLIPIVVLRVTGMT